MEALPFYQLALLQYRPTKGLHTKIQSFANVKIMSYQDKPALNDDNPCRLNVRKKTFFSKDAFRKSCPERDVL
jgi:hypothetical protein